MVEVEESIDKNTAFFIGVALGLKMIGHHSIFNQNHPQKNYMVHTFLSHRLLNPITHGNFK